MYLLVLSANLKWILLGILIVLFAFKCLVYRERSITAIKEEGSYKRIFWYTRQDMIKAYSESHQAFMRANNTLSAILFVLLLLTIFFSVV
jgi:hypothetical protein